MLNTCRINTCDDPGVRNGYILLRLTKAQDRPVRSDTQASSAVQRLYEASTGAAARERRCPAHPSGGRPRARCEATIGRLIFLDSFERDWDLKPSLGYHPPHVPWDAEADCQRCLRLRAVDRRARDPGRYGDTEDQELTWGCSRHFSVKSERPKLPHKPQW